jgi:aminopeptidase YwaD
MDQRQYLQKANSYLDTLCSVKPNRRTGSPGNRAATDFFAATIEPLGYSIDTTPFDCLDYESGDSWLTCEGRSFDVHISPFSLGCDVTGEIVTVSTVEELEKCICIGNILLMKGDICAEQLMPKNFVFYNPDHHKRIYALLEEKKPAAIVTATTKKPELVGAIYPFPLIEDGDINIPSVYCKDTVGEEIAAGTGQVFRLVIEARRIPTTACNVIARKNTAAKNKIVVTAHIDAWVDTLGALDDASGIVAELLLAEMLRDYPGPLGIEIVAFNGEDYYSAGGQMDYLRQYGSDLDKIVVAINIDGAGYIKGKTAYSFYECPVEIRRTALTVFNNYAGMMEGEPWYQGDHMIFIQNGKPAIAVASEEDSELMSTITHTPKDTPDLVDFGKLIELANALKSLIAGL